jgi:hypothetical protein
MKSECTHADTPTAPPVAGDAEAERLLDEHARTACCYRFPASDFCAEHRRTAWSVCDDAYRAARAAVLARMTPVTPGRPWPTAEELFAVLARGANVGVVTAVTVDDVRAAGYEVIG